MRVTLYIVGSKSFTNILKISKLLLFVFWLNEENDQNQSEPIVDVWKIEERDIVRDSNVGVIFAH